MGAGDSRLQRGTPRVVLNATALFHGGSGVQTYVAELLHALGSTQLDGFAVQAIVDRACADSLPSNIGARVVRADSGWRRKARGAWPVAADVVHGLDVDIPWIARGARRVATVHDLAQLDTPWAFGRSAWSKRRLTEFACRRADALIAVSTFTAERIEARFGREAVVVHEAPRSGLAPAAANSVGELRRRLDLPERFVLYVGNLEPRKDVPVLAAACRSARVPLVIAGGAVSTVAVPDGVRSIGYVDLVDLPALYGAATVVAYVSRYEGFGLPPVEALACGATVMATATGALREVAPRGIEFVPIGDADAQATRLRELLGDDERRAEVARIGHAEVANLAWSRTASETAAVWRGDDRP